MRSSIDVHNFLQAKGIKHEIFLSSTPPLSCQRAAALLGLSPQEIVKCVLFISEGEPVLTLVRGSDHVHMGKLKGVLSSTEVRMASLEEVLKITGYTLGATPPVALAHPVKVIMDKRILENEVVYTGGGDVTAVLKIRSKDLEEVTKAEVEDIAHTE